MSFYTYYQAMPESGRLFERLKSDHALRRLYTGLIPYGPGPFHLRSLDPAELEEILDGFVGEESFGSRADVDRRLNDLTTELTDAAAAHPGLENRATYIEKLHREIEIAVARKLSPPGFEHDVRLMTELLYGDALLAPEGPGRREEKLFWSPSSTVSRGASLLAEVELSEEAPDVCDYACEQDREWKDLLVEAAARGEGVIILRAP